MKLIFLSALWLVSSTLFAEGKVYETVLDNGLKVIVKEDHRAPIMVSQVWYKVGSSYEPAGVTGVSHVLEHMMFKGTEKYAPGEFSRIIASNGGSENAFTGRDYTAYFQTMSKDRLALSMEMEADRMRNLKLLPEEFAKEIEVVKEERRLRTEDKPTSKTYEQFSALAYRSLPYSNPVIGWMNDLNHMEVEDLAKWYQLWYAPNNATLVVVGDVDPDEVIALAKQHFGPLKAENIPRLKPLREAPQVGEIRSTVRVPAREPYLLMGYKAPSAATATTDWEPYALEVLAAILDGGNSSRLSRNLVRGKEIAVSAGAGYNAFSRLSSMFLLDGVPSKGHTIPELEQALRSEVNALKESLVSEQDLERVRAQVIASRVFELDSVFYQAMKIGTLETIGLNWHLLDEYVDRVKAITSEQLRQVAQKYLVNDSLTVTVLEPLSMESAKPAKSEKGNSNGE